VNWKEERKVAKGRAQVKLKECVSLRTAVKTIDPFPSQFEMEEDETDTSEEERIKKDGFCRQLKYGGCQKNSELDVVYKFSCFCLYV
jgi:hypothetical protein